MVNFNSMTYLEAHNSLHTEKDLEKAVFLQRFFKTGPGQYGEGDQFLGISVPVIRALAKKFRTLAIKDIQKLLKSPFNEERSLALFILVDQYQKSDEPLQTKIYEFYLNKTQYINNWNLVDSSSYHIVGHYLLEKPRTPLYKLAKAASLWERRIAIVSTLYLIRHQQFEDTFKLTTALLKDKEDLIHKACGWMLREVGKKNERALEQYLHLHGKNMPRTMLRYAIERFSQPKRLRFLRT